MDRNVISDCTKILARHRLKIAFVESATAGRLAFEFSMTTESAQLLGGLVCYDASLKEKALGIPATFVEKYTPESAEVTQLMAANFHRLYLPDVCVGVTGLTAPGGSESPEKPVGTMFAHVIFPNEQFSLRWEFKGSPEEIVEQTVVAVASEIISYLSL